MCHFSRRAAPALGSLVDLMSHFGPESFHPEHGTDSGNRKSQYLEHCSVNLRFQDDQILYKKSLI